jgi:hypothetical protein
VRMIPQLESGTCRSSCPGTGWARISPDRGHAPHGAHVAERRPGIDHRAREALSMFAGGEDEARCDRTPRLVAALPARHELRSAPRQVVLRR